MPPVLKQIDVAKVRKYRNLYFSWTSIGEILGVSRNTLVRWRERVAYEDEYEAIDDEELDAFVFRNAQSRRGEVYTAGLLQAFNVVVTRQRLRASILRVDAVGRENRKYKALQRRQYTCNGPHHQWHIDGHHKLIRYGLVTHGGVDGFSRAIVFLRCVDNNKATTVLKSFNGGVQKFMLPASVRSDRGGENVLVADTMLLNRGVDAGVFKVGCSKYNTRIEAMWKQVYDKCIGFYHQMFGEWEQDGFDVGNDLHVFVLQYLFLKRINEDLDWFAEGWNKHKLRTEKPRVSPYQLIAMHEDLYPQVVEMENEVIENDDEIVPEDQPYVQIDPINCPLSVTQLEYFKLHRAPLTLEDGNESLYDSYLCALEFALRVIEFME